jgi:hypothetical protein
LIDVDRSDSSLLDRGEDVCHILEKEEKEKKMPRLKFLLLVSQSFSDFGIYDYFQNSQQILSICL